MHLFYLSLSPILQMEENNKKHLWLKLNVSVYQTHVSFLKPSQYIIYGLCHCFQQLLCLSHLFFQLGKSAWTLISMAAPAQKAKHFGIIVQSCYNIFLGCSLCSTALWSLRLETWGIFMHIELIWKLLAWMGVFTLMQFSLVTTWINNGHISFA